MRSISFYLTAVVLGVGGGAVAFRALSPSGWTAAVDTVTSVRTHWARSASPFDAPQADAPLVLQASTALTVGRAVSRSALDANLFALSTEGLSLRADRAERGLTETLVEGRNLAHAAGAWNGQDAPSAGLPRESALTRRGGPDDASAQWEGTQPPKVPLARHLRNEPSAAMLPADAKGQPLRTEQEVANLGPQDLALGFFPGSRLQPGQSLRSFESRSTTTSVTLAATAPLSEVAAFYRTQFSANGGSAYKELRAGPGELAFSSESGSTRGDRRAYLFQNGDTVLITLVRTQPGIVR